MTEIEVTVEDARRCNRLRGLPVASCGCRIGDDGWQECPPGAHLAVLHPDVIRDCLRLAEAQPLGVYRDAPRATAMMTGEMCGEPGCGGFLIRTGTCMTCQSCGNNEGCG